VLGAIVLGGETSGIRSSQPVVSYTLHYSQYIGTVSSVTRPEEQPRGK